MPSFRYSRWDGSQDGLFLNEDALMDEVSDELLTHGDVTSALRNLARRGLQSERAEVKGLQDLLEQLRERRQEELDRYDLSSVIGQVRQRLESIREHESRGVQRQGERAQEVRQRLGQEDTAGLDPETAERLLKDLERRSEAGRHALASIPWDHPGKAVEQLRSYEFTDTDAKREFDELLRTLQQQAAETLFKDLSQSLREMQAGGDTTGLKEMLKDLNGLLQRRLQGDSSGFEEFMRKYGAMFGDDPPKTLDDLIAALQKRMAQTDSLLQSLSPQQRQELRGLINAAFGDPDLAREMRRLVAALEALDPLTSLRRDHLFSGKDDLDLSGALDVMERLQDIDRVEQQLRRAHQSGNLQNIDSDLVDAVLGEEARQDLDRLGRMSSLLEDAGYIHKAGNHFELTPKGMRKIGQRALQEIFALIKKDRAGSHLTKGSGQGQEIADTTKVYEFGDPFLPHLQRSIFNAVLRGEEGIPVRMLPQDLEVYQTEHLAQASTVLMLDLSLSMAMRGNFMAAKKVALALDNLIRTRFPRDKLFIVGFSTYARLMPPDKLAYLRWDEFEPYTNIQGGLQLSQKLLSKEKGGTKQIIMISDGEPTAHMEGGQVFLQYPPSPRTIRQTLAEVKRCTQNHITINTFMLDRSTYLVDFVEQMTRLNRGRVFYTTPEGLGKYILVDYMNSRRQKVVV